MTRGEMSHLIFLWLTRATGARAYASPRRRAWSLSFINNTKKTSQRRSCYTGRATSII